MSDPSGTRIWVIIDVAVGGKSEAEEGEDVVRLASSLSSSVDYLRWLALTAHA